MAEHTCSAILRFARSWMKTAPIVGILLIVVAIIGFALGGISFAHEKKDVALGPLQVRIKKRALYRFHQFSTHSP
jgi:hypothetical protein